MREIIAILACLFFFVVSELHAENTSKETPISSKGQTVISENFTGLSVRVIVKTHEMDIGKPSDERPDIIDSNCTYTRHPCSIVDRVDIMVNGKSIFVPRSVYSDLADLNSGEINIEKRKALQVTFTGGDASESYIVKIKFDEEGVKRRVLIDTESKKPLQETTYYKVILD